MKTKRCNTTQAMCEVHCDHQLQRFCTAKTMNWLWGGASFSPKNLLVARRLFSSAALSSAALLFLPPPPLLTPLLLPPPPPDLIPPCNYHLRLQLKATTIKAAEEGGRGEVSGVEGGGWETGGWVVGGGANLMRHLSAHVRARSLV